MTSLEIVKIYLFGTVKFLDLLVIAMLIDIVTGVAKSWKNEKLRSRTALFGYARKIGIFGIIIAANIIDVILGLNGTVAIATVLFYLANELLSITENCAELGIPIPQFITDKLHVLSEEKDKNEISNVTNTIKEEK